MDFQAVIGIEVHAQLNTKSKFFCGCSTQFAAEPNTNVCPVCLGFPGSLPVLNKKAIDYTIKTCLALDCEIPEQSRFARKNYYYPDLPKAYQISQYELPIGRNGRIEIEVNGRKKVIRIHRIHIEEDAGKLVHEAGGGSFVDYNRGGTPLMEIVSEADISSSEEAVAYLTNLRSILQYIGVCEGNMEKGEMRCEPNISVMPVGSDTWGTKAELKNLNSFKAVSRGIDYEISRQIELIEDGGAVVQETRRWDDATQTTQTMRIKEQENDYRYFPDPDLVPVEIDEKWLDELRASITELPAHRKKRFIEELELPEYDAGVLTGAKELADYFEAVLSEFNDPKQVSNWIMTELMGQLNEKSLAIGECKITAVDFAELLELIKKGTINARIGKDIFKEMFETGKSAKSIIEEKDLVQVSDEGELEGIIEDVISANEGPVEDFRNGKGKAIGFLVGQVMKKTGGKANPQVVNRILKQKIEMNREV
ncbi:MAG TPA: Asp-tRNA(Asn)/Glu-tRNA(Gln) amidotransferase subunit GatB [bacterium]|nr:Asp-tRNA(Asn)/Glu-tRNA(Gln) amidotransferase subunit GatB [bacterium]